MPASSTRLGPGTLTLGDTATPFDASCQMENGVISWDKDADDPITVLCGEVVPGAVRYNSTLSGTFLQDLDLGDAGLVAYTWNNKGVTVPFEFVPNTAAGATVTGELIIDPLDVGSTEDYGTIMASDFEWDLVGEPTITFAASPLAAEPALA